MADVRTPGRIEESAHLLLLMQQQGGISRRVSAYPDEERRNSGLVSFPSGHLKQGGPRCGS